MRAADQVFRSERVGLARPGSTTAHIRGGRPTGAAQQRRRAGAHIFIGCVAHFESRDIRDEILGSGAKHGFLAWLRCDDCQSLEHQIRDDLAMRAHRPGNHAGVAAGNE